MALSTPHRPLPAQPLLIVALPLAFGLMVGASACSPTASSDIPTATNSNESGSPTEASTAPDLVRYTVRFVDQNAQPVPGVTLQVCNDAFCQLFVSDEAGACVFELEPRAWEAHVLSAPVGYAVNDEGAHALPETGGELVIELAELREGAE